MLITPPFISDILPELRFTASRSSGPGGQHANKVSTRVTLRWPLKQSKALDDAQRQRILARLGKYISGDQVLQLSAGEYRSRYRNQMAVIDRLGKLLEQAFAAKKPRKPTRPTRASVEKRLAAKKRHSEKKRWRRGAGE